MYLEDLRGHDRPILDTGIMCETKHVPDDQVLVGDVVFALNHVVHSALLYLALQRIRARGIQLVFLVLGGPDVVLREERSLVLQTAW